MREYIKEDAYDSYFLKLWADTKREFFKCETRQIYNESGEEEFIALFKANKFDELRDLLEKDVQQHNSIWCEAKNRKIKFIRVHIITEPLSEYLKFEFEAYKVQSSIGKEEIWIIPFEALKKINKSEIKDFMLFDEKKAIVIDYNKDGRIEGALITDDIRDLDKLIDYKKNLLKNGEEFNTYLSKLNKAV
jgi:hypothetical protein